MTDHIFIRLMFGVNHAQFSGIREQWVYLLFKVISYYGKCYLESWKYVKCIDLVEKFGLEYGGEGSNNSYIYQRHDELVRFPPMTGTNNYLLNFYLQLLTMTTHKKNP